MYNEIILIELLTSLLMMRRGWFFTRGARTRQSNLRPVPIYLLLQQIPKENKAEEGPLMFFCVRGRSHRAAKRSVKAHFRSRRAPLIKFNFCVRQNFVRKNVHDCCFNYGSFHSKRNLISLISRRALLLIKPARKNERNFSECWSITFGALQQKIRKINRQ